MNKNKSIDLKSFLENTITAIEPDNGVAMYIDTLESRIPNNLLFDASSNVFEPENVALSNDVQIRPMSVEETKQFESQVNECIDEIFVEGVHYGSVPGVKKKFIFKAGCEVILSMMGLVARTSIVDKIEDYSNGVFSYTSKTYLIDSSGCVRAEGYGVCNSKENKYLKMNPFNVQNVLIKLSRKRSITDAVLSVASLSNKFSQDEDLVISEQKLGSDTSRPQDNNSNGYNEERPASQKQILFLQNLMSQHGTTVEAINKYVAQTYGVDDYHNLSGAKISQLIAKFKNVRN